MSKRIGQNSQVCVPGRKTQAKDRSALGPQGSVLSLVEENLRETENLLSRGDGLLLEFALVIVVSGIFLLMILFLVGKKPILTRSEARQRGVRLIDGHVVSDRPPKPRMKLGEKVGRALSMATDLKTLSREVGGYGAMEGTLYVGENPTPKETRLRTSGGVPLCPLCGMPMEKMRPVPIKRPLDFFVWREAEGVVPWRCFHKFPVIFVPKQRDNNPGS